MIGNWLRRSRAAPYFGDVTFVVLGLACVLLYSVMAAYMGVTARRDPRRTFRIGDHGRITPREVTASEWIRRYVPWGLGGGLLITMFGLFLTSKAR